MAKEFNTPENFEQYSTAEKANRHTDLVRDLFPGVESLLAEADKALNLRGVQLSEPRSGSGKNEMVVRKIDPSPTRPDKDYINKVAGKLLNY